MFGSVKKERALVKVKTVYLVEAFDPTFDYSGGEVVSLMPEVSYECGRLSIPYTLLDDYYDEAKLREGEDSYFQNQLQWFKDFDFFLSSHISFAKENNISLSTAYYRRIKYFTDSLAIQSFMMRSLLNQISQRSSSAKLVYVRKEDRAERLYDLEKYGQKDDDTFFFQLFSLLVPEYSSISYSFHEFEEVQKSETKPRFNNSFIKEVLKQIKHIIQFETWRKKPLLQASGIRALFMSVGTDRMDMPLKRLMDKGADIYVYSKESIYDLNTFFRRKCISFNDRHDVQIESDCTLAAKELHNEKQLFQFVNDKCGFDVFTISFPFLSNFVKETCSKMLTNAIQLKRLFDAEGIDFVIANEGKNFWNACALIASQMKPEVITVGIQHGIKLHEDKVWEMTDLDPFDHYLTTDTFSEEDYKRVSNNAYLSPTEIKQSSHFLQSLKFRAGNTIKRVRKQVLYVPTKFSAHRRYFNNMMSPLLSYFEFQKSLLDYLSKQRDFEFVFKKADSSRKWAEKSIVKYIQDRNYSNISIATGPLQPYMEEADAVLLDRPTTAYFEALALGKPTLSLNYQWMGSGLSPISKDYFGKTIQEFKTTGEAILIVENFLSESWSEYKKDIPLKRNDIVQLLNDMKRETASELLNNPA